MGIFQIRDILYLDVKTQDVDVARGGKKHIFNSPNTNINCKSNNLIYLLTCESCGLQYVGETALALNKRMNIHRTSKKGRDHIISHFKECCQESSFFIQVICILAGSGYDEDGELDKDILIKRLDRGNVWIKTLRTFYPYGLNERKRKSSNYVTIGSLHFPIKRFGKRNCRCRNRRNHKQSRKNTLEFMELFNNQLSTYLRCLVLEITK